MVELSARCVAAGIRELLGRYFLHVDRVNFACAPLSPLATGPSVQFSRSIDDRPLPTFVPPEAGAKIRGEGSADFSVETSSIVRRGRGRTIDTVERLLRWQRWLTGTPVVSFAFTRELERRKGCAADTRKEGDSCTRVPPRVFVCKSVAFLSLSPVRAPSPSRTRTLFYSALGRASRFSFLIPFIFILFPSMQSVWFSRRMFPRARYQGAATTEGERRRGKEGILLVREHEVILSNRPCPAIRSAPATQLVAGFAGCLGGGCCFCPLPFGRNNGTFVAGEEGAETKT